MVVGGYIHTLAALPPGRKPGTHCIGGWVDPTVFDRLTVQPVASCYTD